VRPIWLQTPNRVPGDYDFAPYGRDFLDVTARDAATRAPLAIRRLGWQG